MTGTYQSCIPVLGSFVVDSMPQAAKISSPRDARIVQVNPLAVRKSRNAIIVSSVDGERSLPGIL